MVLDRKKIASALGFILGTTIVVCITAAIIAVTLRFMIWIF